MAETTVPEIRFQGFNDEWTERKFAELAQRKAHVVNTSSMTVEYEDIDSGYGSLNKELRNKTSQKPGVAFEPGDVLFGKLRPYLKNWLNPDFAGAAVGDFWVLRGTEVEPSFLYSLVQGDAFTAVSNVSSGSKMPRSDWGLVSQSLFTVPPALAEQQRIGAFFSQLDDLISDHRKKLTKLQQTKTSLLQKMFPQGGADEPELRVGGFSGAWKRVRLGSFDIKTGPFGSTLHASDYVLTGTPIVTTEHFKSGRLPNSVSGLPQVSNEDVARLASYQLEVGDIVFSRVGSVDLNAQVTDQHAGWLFSGRVLRVRLNSSFDPACIHSALETDGVRSSILSRAVGLTMPSINTKILGDTLVVLPPTIKEQRVIGKLFSEFDDLIVGEQQYIEKLKQAKTSLLQKMFV